MDNAQKAIMIGVGLFITILIISVVMLIVTPAVEMIRSAVDSIGGLSESLQNQLTASYDDVTVTGSTVITAVNLYCTEDMVIEVKATSGADYLEYGQVRGNGTLVLDSALSYDSSNVQSKVSVLTDSSNTTNYVPSSAKYHAELIKSSSGDVVMGIRFTRTT